MKMRTFKEDLEKDLKDPEFAELFWKEYRKTGRKLKWEFRLKHIWAFIKEIWEFIKRWNLSLIHI